MEPTAEDTSDTSEKSSSEAARREAARRVTMGVVGAGPAAPSPDRHKFETAHTFDDLFQEKSLAQHRPRTPSPSIREQSAGADSVTASEAMVQFDEATKQNNAKFERVMGATSSQKLRKLKRDATQKVIIHEDYYHERALQYAERLRAVRSKSWRRRLAVFLDDPMSSKGALAFAIVVALAIGVQLVAMLLLSWRVMPPSQSATIDTVLTVFFTIELALRTVAKRSLHDFSPIGRGAFWWIDLVAVIPWYVVAIVRASLNTGRMARGTEAIINLVRVLRTVSAILAQFWRNSAQLF